MERKIYITDGFVALCEYRKETDDMDFYHCWKDQDTEKGYNLIRTETFEEFANHSIRSRFIATVVRCSDNACVGIIFVSPDHTLPDLAIMLYPPYRGQGYGTADFSLGVQYCFETLKVDRLHAGCYESNTASMAMLKKCGFQPHPEGNVNEKHYLTGEDIVQYDFVRYRRNDRGEMDL